MIMPYAARLLCISAAAFFLVHTVLSVLLHLLTGSLTRMAGALPSRRAAGLLFWARLAPALCGLFAVAAFCIPSFLWLEDEAGPEAVGILSLMAAALGVAVWCVSIGRGLRAAVRSSRYRRICETTGRPAAPVGALPVRVLDGSGGLMVLAGVVRPVLVVSRAVMETLEPAQLEAAISHEGAHRDSRDNLRRLLMLLSPGLFPFYRGLRTIEDAWSRFAEWAADDHAAAGDGGRSLSLAEALVGVARLGAATSPHLLATPLLTAAEEIGVRIDRLLGAPLPVEPGVRQDRVLQVSAVFLFLAALGAVLVRPATMQAAHEALEQLIR